MSIDPIAVLEAIVAEVAGAGQPFSADSYLPAHLIHDARQAIEAEHKDAAEWKAREAYEALLLARLAKADEVIADLRKSNSDLAKAAIAGIEITDKERQEILEKHGHSPLVFDPAGRFIDQPPDSLFGQWKSASSPDDASRLMHVTVYARQECDA